MNKLSKLTAIALFVLPSLSLSLFTNEAKAHNKFDVCLEELTKSGVAIEEAQVGCADALNPKELSRCVRKITESTAIKGIDALKNCHQVRRPIELGNCVVDIQEKVLSAKKKTETSSNDLNQEEASPVMMALNTCRASLLPDRHSQCVVALSRTPEVSNAIEAMESCISAEDFPRELYPVN